MRRWGLRGGFERWVGFRRDWKTWVEVGGVRFGEARLRRGGGCGGRDGSGEMD